MNSGQHPNLLSITLLPRYSTEHNILFSIWTRDQITSLLSIGRQKAPKWYLVYLSRFLFYCSLVRMTDDFAEGPFFTWPNISGLIAIPYALRSLLTDLLLIPSCRKTCSQDNIIDNVYSGTGNTVSIRFFKQQKKKAQLLVRK